MLKLLKAWLLFCKLQMSAFPGVSIYICECVCEITC